LPEWMVRSGASEELAGSGVEELYDVPDFSLNFFTT
jgi:hypothetical protein